MIINSFFTQNSVPTTGLTPTIRIWQVDSSSQTLIITDEPMVEVGDGFYKYDFTSYNPANDYLFRTDGGVSQPTGERYNIGATETSQITQQQADDIASAVWDQSVNDHVIIGTTGLTLAQTKADTTNIVIGQSSITALLQTLLKYQTNRTKIDINAKTLTIYDDDCTTAIKVFDLLDSAGNPSVVEVVERKPTTCP